MRHVRELLKSSQPQPLRTSLSCSLSSNYQIIEPALTPCIYVVGFSICNETCHSYNESYLGNVQPRFQTVAGIDLHEAMCR